MTRDACLAGFLLLCKLYKEDHFGHSIAYLGTNMEYIHCKYQTI